MRIKMVASMLAVSSAIFMVGCEEDTQAMQTLEKTNINATLSSSVNTALEGSLTEPYVDGAVLFQSKDEYLTKYPLQVGQNIDFTQQRVLTIQLSGSNGCFGYKLDGITKQNSILTVTTTTTPVPEDVFCTMAIVNLSDHYTVNKSDVMGVTGVEFIHDDKLIQSVK